VSVVTVHPPPRCPKCRKPMHFIVLKTGGRKFQCVRCDDADPMRLADIQALIKGELQPPKLHSQRGEQSSRSTDIRRVAKEYIDDQRELLRKLRRISN